MTGTTIELNWVRPCRSDEFGGVDGYEWEKTYPPQTKPIVVRDVIDNSMSIAQAMVRYVKRISPVLIVRRLLYRTIPDGCAPVTHGQRRSRGKAYLALIYDIAGKKIVIQECPAIPQSNAAATALGHA